MTVPLELGEAGLQRLGRHEVEVVGRLVEQQHRRPGQLEQQDLEAGLLAAADSVSNGCSAHPCSS